MTFVHRPLFERLTYLALAAMAALPFAAIALGAPIL